jgi:hypothetical protein
MMLHVFLMSSNKEVVPALEHALMSPAYALKCTVLFLEKLAFPLQSFFTLLYGFVKYMCLTKVK